MKYLKLILLLFIANCISAAITTFEFSGLVDVTKPDVFPPASGYYPIFQHLSETNNSFSFKITYDTDMPLNYEYHGMWSEKYGLYQPSLIDYSLTIADIPFSIDIEKTNMMRGGVSVINGKITEHPYGGGSVIFPDRYGVSYAVFNSSMHMIDCWFSIGLKDLTTTVFDDTSLPDSLSLNDFSDTDAYFYGFIEPFRSFPWTEAKPIEFSMSGKVHSLKITQTVPEPMTIIIFCLSFLGFAGIRRKSIKSS